MSLPFALPDWVPWWVPLAVLLPLILYGLAVLAMPFSVLGLKGRLEAIEGRLDEIQGEIRSLSLRLPEPARGASLDTFRRAAPRSAGLAMKLADEEAPLVQRPMAADVRSGEPDETLIPPMPRPAAAPVPSSIVPIPPASRDLSAQPRRFIRPITRPEAARQDAERDLVPPPRTAAPRSADPRPSDSLGGGRSEPRIDWPR